MELVQGTVTTSSARVWGTFAIVSCLKSIQTSVYWTIEHQSYSPLQCISTDPALKFFFIYIAWIKIPRFIRWYLPKWFPCDQWKVFRSCHQCRQSDAQPRNALSWSSFWSQSNSIFDINECYKFNWQFSEFHIKFLTLFSGLAQIIRRRLISLAISFTLSFKVRSCTFWSTISGPSWFDNNSVVIVIFIHKMNNKCSASNAFTNLKLNINFQILWVLCKKQCELNEKRLNTRKHLSIP